MFASYKTMDVNILLSVVNMKLRDESQSLVDFCARYQLDKNTLTVRLQDAGFSYDLSQNQFKSDA